jgi:hypothetical protein
MLRALCITTLLIAALAQPATAREPIAYVVNASGETLSKINLATGAVSNDFLTLGSDVLSYPNQIVVRDTLAYVLCSGTDELQIIDLASETTLDLIDLGHDFSPYWMAFLDSQYVFVSSFQLDRLAKVDVINRSVVDSWPIGLSPEGVLIDDARVHVAITAFDKDYWTYGPGKVVVFDTGTDTVVDEYLVGTNPQYLARDSQGRIHVVCTGDYYSVFGEVYVYDPSLGTLVDSAELGGSPGNPAIGPSDTAHVAAGGWYGDGYVYSYDALSLEVYHGSANPLVVDSGCMMVVPYQDSTTLVGAFSDFIVQMASDGTELGRWAVGDGPAHCDFNYVPGDINGSFQVEIADLVYLVNWFFKQGPAPGFETWRANVNGDRGYDIADVVYLVNYMFKQGPPPRVGPRWF